MWMRSPVANAGPATPRSTDAATGGIFCATVLQVALTGRYPAHCPAEFGLSSPGPREPCGVTQHQAAIVSPAAKIRFYYPSVSCEIWVLLELLYRLLRGVSMTSAVFEIFQPFSRNLETRNARSALSFELAQRSGSADALASRCGLRARRRHGGSRRPNRARQIGDIDRLTRRHDDQPLDGVAQLADVALPAIALHRVERRLRDATRPRVVLAG